MRTAYLIGHTAIQSMFTTIAFLILPFVGFFVSSGVMTSAIVLMALILAKMITYIFVVFWLRVQHGKGRNLLTVLLTASLTVVILFFSGLVNIAQTWILVLGVLIFADIFAHGTMKASGAKEE